MTSILEHPKDKNFVSQIQGCIFVRQMDKQLGVVGIKMEFHVRVPCNNLNQKSGRGPRTEPCGTPNSLRNTEGLPNFYCLESEAEIRGQPLQGHATHTKR